MATMDVNELCRLLGVPKPNQASPTDFSIYLGKGDISGTTFARKMVEEKHRDKIDELKARRRELRKEREELEEQEEETERLSSAYLDIYEEEKREYYEVLEEEKLLSTEGEEINLMDYGQFLDQYHRLPDPDESLEEYADYIEGYLPALAQRAREKALHAPQLYGLTERERRAEIRSFNQSFIRNSKRVISERGEFRHQLDRDAFDEKVGPLRKKQDELLGKRKKSSRMAARYGWQGFAILEEIEEIDEELEEIDEELEELRRPVRSTSFPAFSVYISEKSRRRNTYVTGMTGSGKSELLKIVAHAYAKRPEYGAVVVIDPHGDFSEEIAQWKEFSTGNRLIYVDPYMEYNHSPTINPFEVKKHETPEKQAHAEELTTQAITKGFEELMRAEGTSITSQMKTLIEPCVATIVRIGGTLADLQQFMVDGANDGLIRAGLESPNPVHRDFFRTGFHWDRYGQTKQSIYTKIQALFNRTPFYHLVVGKSTFDLESALNARKVIVFNLARGRMGEESSDAFGRFIIGMLQSIAFRRANVSKRDRVPVHVFIDECQFYISESIETILTGARKYGVHLTLAQQVLGQDMSAQLKKVVLGGGVNIKIAGMNGLATLRTLANEMGTSVEDLQQLEVGQFFLKVGSFKAFPFQAPTHLLGNNNAMTDREWERVRAQQVRRYYRSTFSKQDDVRSPDVDSQGREGGRRRPKYDLPD